MILFFSREDISRILKTRTILTVVSFSDLRDDKQFFVDHPGAVPISTVQVNNLISTIRNLILFLLFRTPFDGCNLTWFNSIGDLFSSVGYRLFWESSLIGSVVYS